MRKFMTLAAVLAVAACGEKKAEAPAAEAPAMAPAAEAPAAAPMDSAAAAATTVVDSAKAAMDSVKH